jgi:hypothetical protein
VWRLSLGGRWRQRRRLNAHLECGCHITLVARPARKEARGIQRDSGRERSLEIIEKTPERQPTGDWQPVARTYIILRRSRRSDGDCQVLAVGHDTAHRAHRAGRGTEWPQRLRAGDGWSVAQSKRCRLDAPVTHLLGSVPQPSYAVRHDERRTTAACVGSFQTSGPERSYTDRLRWRCVPPLGRGHRAGARCHHRRHDQGAPPRSSRHRQYDGPRPCHDGCDAQCAALGRQGLLHGPGRFSARPRRSYRSGRVGDAGW